MTKRRDLPGLTMDEVRGKIGVSRRTIYGWVRAGLLPRPTSSGPGVRYDNAFADRATTIGRLRDEGLSFDQIRRHLATPPPPPASPAPLATPAGLPSEHWERLTLLPGLELFYRTDGGPVLRRLAAEIWKQFGATPAG